MIEESIGRVAHRSNGRELVVDLCQAGDDISEINARDFSGDVLEFRPNVVGHRVRFFGIPKVEVTRASLQIYHDNRLRLAPAFSVSKLAAC